MQCYGAPDLGLAVCLNVIVVQFVELVRNIFSHMFRLGENTYREISKQTQRYCSGILQIDAGRAEIRKMRGAITQILENHFARSGGKGSFHGLDVIKISQFVGIAAQGLLQMQFKRQPCERFRVILSRNEGNELYQVGYDFATGTETFSDTAFEVDDKAWIMVVMIGTSAGYGVPFEFPSVIWS